MCCMSSVLSYIYRSHAICSHHIIHICYISCHLLEAVECAGLKMSMMFYVCVCVCQMLEVYLFVLAPYQHYAPK